MTLVKRKAKTKVSTKSKRSNPDRDFKRELDNLVDERVRVSIITNHVIFSGQLKYSSETRRNYWMSITDNAFLSFKPSDVESISEDDVYTDITLM
jgi:hypothetical protein